ncbi:MAG: hypothetical protein HYV63_18670 [Candidatus Schekmanbacteria bacterium]|nr:hypothetical protein [Candidatus Schekmanbacteria bacterium]
MSAGVLVASVAAGVLVFSAQTPSPPASRPLATAFTEPAPRASAARPATVAPTATPTPVPADSGRDRSSGALAPAAGNANSVPNLVLASVLDAVEQERSTGELRAALTRLGIGGADVARVERLARTVLEERDNHRKLDRQLEEHRIELRKLDLVAEDPRHPPQLRRRFELKQQHLASLIEKIELSHRVHEAHFEKLLADLAAATGAAAGGFDLHETSNMASEAPSRGADQETAITGGSHGS